MKSRTRFTLLALLAGALVALSAPAAAQAAFGIEKWVAVNCKDKFPKCAAEEFGPFSIPKEPTKPEAEEQGYVQAEGHVPFGVTDFKVNTEGELAKGEQKPQGAPLTHIRVDVGAGLATSPNATPQCSMEEFGTTEAVPGTHFFLEPKCKKPETEVGLNKVTVFAGAAGDVPLEGTVYNVVPREGIPLEFGVALKLPIPLTKAILEKAFFEHPLPLPEPEKKLTEEALEKQQYFAHTLIEGNVEWGQEARGTNKGDYHDYFEIDVSPALPLISSRLVFFGTRGEGDLITNASSCPGDDTSFLSLTNAEGTVRKAYTTPIGLSGCDKVPFEPLFSVAPAPSTRDEPDGLGTVVGLTRHPKEEVDSAQLKEAVVKLPEGMTLNPSGAHGLEACTPAQARIHSDVPGVACPAGSELGTVSLEVPTLPSGSLSGHVYLGGPESGPITGPPYIVYLDAESKRYGVSVRVKGEVFPNEATGQLTTFFNENPEQPFTTAALHFKEGALAPIANPLACGTASSEASFIPYTGTATQLRTSPFTVDNEGKGGGCPSPLPFAPTQSTANQVPNAGANTSFTFTLERPNGQQYLTRLATVLPPGLIGLIPKVEQCGEAQATSGTCPPGSGIGTVRASAGSGPTPFEFEGNAYLTGPYEGAPYGMAFVLPTVAGPFNLGLAIARATINIDPHSARVIVSSLIPTIVKGGVPVRLQKLSVSINRQGFLVNPTNCGVLATESLLNGIFGGVQHLSSPFQVANCSKLAFKPSFKVKTSARTSKANGASLETTLDLAAGGSNVKSVLVTLPVQLPSRLTTLQKACPEATFAAHPFACPSGSFVGGVRANTPALKEKMKGPAILVSHGGAAFPDLDLVLDANNVRVILTGSTDIKKGITTSNFSATPDVPVSSITVNLPTGPHSALAAHGDLCLRPLVMPTQITGQNGRVVKQNTKIKVADCGVKIIGHKVVGNTAYLTVKTFNAGRVSGSGANLKTVYRHFKGAMSQTALNVPLNSAGLSKHRPFRVRLRVGFFPKSKKIRPSEAFVTVVFR